MSKAPKLTLNVSNFGYALMLSINATSIWGGIFPYLPAACQTAAMTTTYYALQLTALIVTFCAALWLTWRHPRRAMSPHVLVWSVALAVGSLMLVAAMYLEDQAPMLIVCGGVLIGVGQAGFLLGWQRVFAAMDAARGSRALVEGTGFSAVVFLAICLIPPALCAYVVPLVMVPLAGLCLWLAAESTSVEQPMFEDVPAEHPTVYSNAIRESLPVALSIGALGFCSGAIRFIAVLHQELMGTINVVSMLVLLAIVAGFYWLWWRQMVRLDLANVFSVLMPVAGTCLIVLPFAGTAFTTAGFAITYACFMLACMLMMAHCANISRDSGINPAFIYAFYGAIVYCMLLGGYLLGFASGSGSALGMEQLSMVAVVSLYVMLLVSLLARRVGKLHTSRLEFLMITPQDPRKNTSAEIAVAKAVKQSQGSEGDEGPESADSEAPTASAAPAAGEDPTTRRCAKVGELYGLSSRETEVMELLMRGNTIPGIAEKLFISENTVRTHSRRIYAKLGIHKRQELRTLVESIDEAL